MDCVAQGIKTSRTLLPVNRRIYGSSGMQWAGRGGSGDANIWVMAKETLFILTTVTCSPSPHITAGHTVHCERGMHVIASYINLARPWHSAIGSNISLAAVGETF